MLVPKPKPWAVLNLRPKHAGKQKSEKKRVSSALNGILGGRPPKDWWDLLPEERTRRKVVRDIMYLLSERRVLIQALRRNKATVKELRAKHKALMTITHPPVRYDWEVPEQLHNDTGTQESLNK